MASGQRTMLALLLACAIVSSAFARELMDNEGGWALM